MTASWLDDLADHIAGAGVIGTVGSSVFQCQFDLDTREGVCITPTGGLLNHSSLPSRPRVQVISRYASGAAAFAKDAAIRARLRTGNITQGANRFLYFKPLHEPMCIGKDSLNLTRFSTNYEVHIS